MCLESKWSVHTRPAIWVVAPNAQGQQVDALVEAKNHGFHISIICAGEEVGFAISTVTFAAALAQVEAALGRLPMPHETRLVDLSDGPVLAIQAVEHWA